MKLVKLSTLAEQPEGAMDCSIEGRPLNRFTLWRWCRRGMRARNGQRIRMEHRRIGRAIYSSAEWLNAFLAELARADAEHFAEPHEAEPASSVDRRLSEHGI